MFSLYKFVVIGLNEDKSPLQKALVWSWNLSISMLIYLYTFRGYCQIPSKSKCESIKMFACAYVWGRAASLSPQARMESSEGRGTRGIEAATMMGCVVMVVYIDSYYFDFIYWGSRYFLCSTKITPSTIITKKQHWAA